MTPEVSHGDYEAAVNRWADAAKLKYLDTVDTHSANALTNMGVRTFVGNGTTEDGSITTYGGAVKPDGDIIGVYSGVKGKSKNIILTALEIGYRNEIWVVANTYLRKLAVCHVRR